jgi:hypothetical protein
MSLFRCQVVSFNWPSLDLKIRQVEERRLDGCEFQASRLSALHHVDHHYCSIKLRHLLPKATTCCCCYSRGDFPSCKHAKWKPSILALTLKMKSRLKFEQENHGSTALWVLAIFARFLGPDRIPNLLKRDGQSAAGSWDTSYNFVFEVLSSLPGSEVVTRQLDDAMLLCCHL